MARFVTSAWQHPLRSVWFVRAVQARALRSCSGFPQRRCRKTGVFRNDPAGNTDFELK